MSSRSSRSRADTTKRRNLRRGGQNGFRPGTESFRRVSGRLKPLTDSQQTAAGKALPPEIATALHTDPAFRICSPDQRYWFSPYTGEPVPIGPLGLEDSINSHLSKHQPWRQRMPMSMVRLRYLSWLEYLRRNVLKDQRFRVFGLRGRGWVNPFSGAWVSDVHAPEMKLGLPTLQQMASALTQCPHAEGGQLLSQEALKEAVQRQDLTPTGSHKAVDVGRKEEQKREQEDAAKARAVQQRLFAQIPSIEGYQLGIHYEGHGSVSGDLYSVHPWGENKFLIVLGDVSGHGVQAALLVSSAIKSLRHLVQGSGGDLVELLTDLNDDIKPDLVAGQFITLFAAVLDTESGVVECVRAGHHPAYVFSDQGETMVRRIGHSGMALGLVSGKLFKASLRSQDFVLEPGEQLFIFTDGVLEAQNQHQEEFGEGRCCGAALSALERGPQAMVDAVSQAVNEFAAGEIGDDLTLMALGVAPPESPPEPQLAIEVEVDDTAETHASEVDLSMDDDPTDVFESLDSPDFTIS